MDYNSGVSIPALAIGLCSIEGEGGDGGGGGGDAGGAAAVVAAAEGGGGGDEAAAAAAAAAAAGEEPEFLKQFSAEGGDADNPSNRDWLKSKGVKSLDDLAKSYREAEHTIRNGGKLTVPGEGAKPEEIAAFHKAIGVPEAVDGYEVKVPEGQSLDEDLMTPLREVALKAGVPKAGFEALAGAVIDHQLNQLQALATAENGSRDELLKEWGPQKDAKMADVNNGMRALGLKPLDVAAMQRGFAMQYGEPGSRRALELLQKIGAGVAEDALLGSDGPRRFGITGAEAQAEIEKLTADKDFRDKLTNKDPDAVARWDRLNGAVAAERDRKARAEAGG